MDIHVHQLAVDNRVAVVPGQLGDGLLQRTALFFIYFLDPEVEIRNDLSIRPCLSRRIDHFVSPLHQPPAVRDTPFLLKGDGAGQHEYFRFYFF